MALINCEECTKEISDKAISCPHCGAPTHASRVAALKSPTIPSCLKCNIALVKTSRVKRSAAAEVIGGILLAVSIIVFFFNWLIAIVLVCVAFLISYLGKEKYELLVCPNCGKEGSKL
jgi:predicted RNA-binding Zn-ribbon protein involved in translation (DUF1610 family)